MYPLFDFCTVLCLVHMRNVPDLCIRCHCLHCFRQSSIVHICMYLCKFLGLPILHICVYLCTSRTLNLHNIVGKYTNTHIHKKLHGAFCLLKSTGFLNDKVLTVRFGERKNSNMRNYHRIPSKRSSE